MATDCHSPNPWRRGGSFPFFKKEVDMNDDIEFELEEPSPFDVAYEKFCTTEESDSSECFELNEVNS